VLPVALADLGTAATQEAALKAIHTHSAAAEDRRMRLVGMVDDLHGARGELQAALEANALTEHEKASYYVGTVVPLMERLRATSDALEDYVSDGSWPLPRYRELLFQI
jgi:glutamine synthetase type III